MDEELELKRFKWILAAGLIFLFSMYYSYLELKYKIWGATAQATVTRTFESVSSGRRGRSTPMLAVEYTFTDSKTGARNERDDVSMDWPVPQGTVEVEYLPGVVDSSRLKGHSNSFAVWMFFGSLAWVSFSIYRLAQEANAPIKKSRRR